MVKWRKHFHFRPSIMKQKTYQANAGRDRKQHPNVISVFAIMYQQQMNFEHQGIERENVIKN